MSFDVMRFKIMRFWQRKRWNDLKVAINNKEDIYTISGSSSTGMRFTGEENPPDTRARRKAALRESQVSVRSIR